jgi:hypothetical protein
MRNTHKLMGWISSVLLLLTLSHAQSDSNASPTDAQTTHYTSLATLFARQIDALQMTDTSDRCKVYLVLRSQDVPVEQRKTLAIRILTGDYPKRVSSATDGLGWLWTAALIALSHLHIDDASLLPFLEENLPKWERIANAYSEEELPEDLRPLKERIYPNLTLTRAVIARLKAVQAVPEIKSAADIERRLDVMLKEVGMTRQELQQLCEEVKEKLYRTRGIGISECGWLAYTVMEEHRRTLFHYAKRGMDVMPAATSLGIEALVEGARLGKEASNLPQLIDAILKNPIYDHTRGRILVDEGIAAVPLIIQKLAWVREHPEEVAFSGMGVSVLLDVLASLIGKDALPYVEQFLSDSSKGEWKWTCGYAHRTKTWIERGDVFGFNPFF